MILSPGSLAGGWESLDGSPDFYIFRDSSGDYRLLAYSLDAEYGRGDVYKRQVYIISNL